MGGKNRYDRPYSNSLPTTENIPSARPHIMNNTKHCTVTPLHSLKKPILQMKMLFNRRTMLIQELTPKPQPLSIAPP
jgi:hypothetical protein